jgi:hypothetical protein
MNKTKTLFLAFALFLLFWCLEAQALTVSIQAEGDPSVPKLQISNENFIERSELYLIWADLDAGAGDELVWSIKEDGTWMRGLFPILNEPTEVPPFSFKGIDLPRVTPPEGHRCFLILMAVSPGNDPLRPQNWVAFSFWPITLEAAMERIPGQRFFLTGQTGTGGFEQDALPPAAPTADPEDTVSELTSTEKPDIYKLDGTQLIYANGQAERVQVIDLSNVAAPEITAWTSVSATPREIYTLEDAIYLLQSDETQTHVSVLSSDRSKNVLTSLQELSLSGRFVESRRRGKVIYTVSQEGGMIYYPENPVVDEVLFQEQTPTLKIYALRIGEDGLVSLSKETSLSGNNPVVAIFPDYLVCAYNEGWTSGKTKVQVFDLTNPNDLLRSLPLLEVSGNIPSEFHLDIHEDTLRLVYGPEDLRSGSTLAIYDLKDAQGPSLIGELPGIAPGESLFATRFVNNRAYVVTYERQDPLWVLDLSDLSSPKILGELEVPGWSEKLFFHDDRLFAMGIDDQPVQGDASEWVRRVSASLFGVSDPSNPRLLDRITPLEGQVSHSYSVALEDERALLLDWNDQHAVFPLESWDAQGGSYLQILTFNNDTFKDNGLMDSPVPLSRAIALDNRLLAAFGDQELFTVKWGEGDPEILGSLELAINLTWIKKSDENLWAAALGRNGYYRLYRYSPSDLNTPQEHWVLPKNYSGVLVEESLAVFYNLYPLGFRVIDLNSGTLKPGEFVEQEEEMALVRSTPLLYQNRLYIAESQILEVRDMPSLGIVPSPPDTGMEQWVIRSWRLDENGAVEEPRRLIPGEPVAFTPQGYLICKEISPDNKLLLDLLSLNEKEATLLGTKELSCDPWASTVVTSGDQLYVACVQEFVPVPGPLPLETKQLNPDQEAPSTELMELLPEANFSVSAQWTFSGSRQIVAVAENTVLLSSHEIYPYIETEPPIERMPKIAPYPYKPSCEVYRLEVEPVLLHELDSCFPAESVALTTSGVYIAEGFQGLRFESWN